MGALTIPSMLANGLASACTACLSAYRKTTLPWLVDDLPPVQGMDLLWRLWGKAFINRNFALLWWGQTISSVGDYAWDTALVLWITTTLAGNQSWAPLAVSGAILAAAAYLLPYLAGGSVWCASCGSRSSRGAFLSRRWHT